jgi:hypothetical protein
MCRAGEEKIKNVDEDEDEEAKSVILGKIDDWWMFEKSIEGSRGR